MRSVPWRLTFRALAVLTLLVSIVWLVAVPGFEPLVGLLIAVGTLIATFASEGNTLKLAATDPAGTLYSPTCGDRGLDLAQQRLVVSTAFGTYFAGLLERDHNYVTLKGQIECPALPGLGGLEPIERIFMALERATGPLLLILAADGGMGKSTLAAKIVRCLFEQKAVDMILGDSAKTERVDAITGEITAIRPAYYDVLTFCERLCSQLSLPFQRDRGGADRAITDIRDRLEGRRAVVVVDNLETVARGDELFDALKKLATRDVRVVLTTRVVSGLRDLSPTSMVVRLTPIMDVSDAQTFLAWHIWRHQTAYPALSHLKPDVADTKRLERLLRRTGGVPLLTQLVFSDIARVGSWDYVEKLPNLFGQALLDFLYGAHWKELGAAGERGTVARRLLLMVSGEQYKGKKVTLDRLAQWAEQNRYRDVVQDALRLLHERFLVVNHDPVQGNFAVFPSLAEFLDRQP